MLDNTRAYNFGVMDADNDVIGQTATSQIQAADQQAAVASAGAAVSGAVGAISSALSGDIAGAVSSAVNGVVGAGTTIANTAITNGLTSAMAQINQDSNEQHAELSTEKSQGDVNSQRSAATNITDTQNLLTSGIASNAAATTIGNATRTQGAENANAARTQSTENANAARTQAQAQSAISNDIAQTGLGAPLQYGTFANGDTATTKPIALFAHVITQSKSAIESAGDEFLRYGYALDKQWPFNGDWNVGRYFTYWKLRDFWVSNLNVPDLYMDKLRFFLFGGVTVWRNPEDIGRVSIYENFATKGV